MMKNMKMSFMIVAVFATVVFSGKVFGLSYESEQGLSFTLNPTISVNLSSNAMTINDLAPGTTSDSNIIKVTAESNAIAGYTLSSTVGNNTTYNTTNMVHTNGTNTFTNLSSNKATLASFDPSTWGYSYAPCTTTECANTPSWISGDITGTTNSGYNGLPLYSTANPIKLINATAPGSSAVQFKFGAKADTAQLAGTYNNVINFIGVGKVITTSYTINYNANGGSGAPAQETGTSTTGAVQISSTQPTRTNYLFKGWCTEQTSDDTCSGETVQPGGMLGLHPGTGNLTPTVSRTLYAMWEDNNPAPPKIYMQDLTLADCQSSASSDNLTVTDRRDDNDYTVKYINGQCWMTQNLRLTGTVSATDSNFSGSDFNVSQYSLDSTDSSYANHCDSTSGTNYACTKDSGSETTGAWYNYYAATAGTISGSSNTNPATSDICPSGWHLPSAPNTTANTDINKLVGNTTSGYQDPTPGLTAFGAVASGHYYNGSLYSPEYGFWWSATADLATDRYSLLYNSSGGQFDGDASSDRDSGLFLRCVKSA